MSTPINKLKQKYDSAGEHLRAIEDAFMAQFKLDETHRSQVRKVVHVAFDVGHRTTTTDDWCDA